MNSKISIMKSFCNFQIKSSKKNWSNKRKQEKIYSKVENKKRLQLLQMVKEDKKSLKEASKLLDINYSTAKTILRVYRIENRILKKTAFCSSPTIGCGNESKEEKVQHLNESTTESSFTSPFPKNSTNECNFIMLPNENSTHLYSLASLIQGYLNEVLYSDYIINCINHQLFQLSNILLSHPMK